MAYELHIERLPINSAEVTPISVENWKAAVLATDGVRLFSAERHSFTNPQAGEVISIQKREGDAEVYFPKQDRWFNVFRFSRGSAHFNARFNIGDSSDPVWKTAVVLA